MPSAGRTSMARMLAAPLMLALAVTLRVAGSMVTMVLPSTSPMIQPASAAVATKEDAASAPAMVRDFIVLSIAVAPCEAVHRWPQLRGRSQEGCKGANRAGSPDRSPLCEHRGESATLIAAQIVIDKGLQDAIAPTAACRYYRRR